MSKRHNSTGKFQFDTAALAASIIRNETIPDEDEVDPIEPDVYEHDADTIHRLISQAIWSGVVSCPGDREIMIYPGSLEEPHVCLITVWDGHKNGSSHVVAGTTEVQELASRLLWKGDDPMALTEAVISQIVAIANGVTEEMNAVDKVLRKRAAGRK